MARRRIGGSETRLMSAAGIAVACLAIVLLALAVLPKEDPRVVALRQFTYDLVSPIMELANKPSEALVGVGQYFTGLETLRSRTRALEAENLALRQRVTELTQAEVLMQQYRQILDLPEEPKLELINARVIADLNSPFVHTLVTKGGRARGIEPGQAVMGLNGLIGRVISSGRNSARILLLNDFNSHIPVVALSSDVQAILSGDNSPQPQLQFLPRQAELKDGDLLITSGRGGQIPIGLPVALVKRDEAGAISVNALDDLQRLNFVRIVKSTSTPSPPDEIQLSPRSRGGANE